tara:strand:+ start:3002 stop:3160 length:159 start_codon:yes stop_codon:yes gene_type:complete
MIQKQLIRLGAITIKHIADSSNDADLGAKVRQSFLKLFNDESKDKLPPAGKS